MAVPSAFPGAVDSFVDPIAIAPGQFVWLDGSIRDGIGPSAAVIVPSNPALIHSRQHALYHSVMTALETKLGVDSSIVVTTIDYLLKNAASVNPGHKHTIAAINASTGNIFFGRSTGSAGAGQEISIGTAIGMLGLNGGAFIADPVPIANGGHEATNAFDGFLNLWNDGTIPDTGTTSLDKDQYMLLWNKGPTAAGSVHGHNIDGFRTEIFNTANANYHPLNNIPLRNALSTKTANYTIVDADGTILVDCTTGNKTITLPTAVGRNAKMFKIKKIDATANTLTVACAGAQTIDGVTTQVTAVQWVCFTPQSNNANWFLV